MPISLRGAIARSGCRAPSSIETTFGAATVEQHPPEMILRVPITEKPPGRRPNLLVRRGGPRYDEMCVRARKPDEADVRDYEWHPDGIKVSLTWWAFAEGSRSQWWQSPTDLTASPQLAKILNPAGA